MSPSHLSGVRFSWLGEFRAHPRVRVAERLAPSAAALLNLQERLGGGVVAAPAVAVGGQDAGRCQGREVTGRGLLGDIGALDISAAANAVAEDSVEIASIVRSGSPCPVASCSSSFQVTTASSTRRATVWACMW